MPLDEVHQLQCCQVCMPHKGVASSAGADIVLMCASGMMGV